MAVRWAALRTCRALLPRNTFIYLNHWVMHPVVRVTINQYIYIYRNHRTQQMSVLVLLCTSYATCNCLRIFCITNHLKMATNRGRNMSFKKGTIKRSPTFVAYRGFYIYIYIDFYLCFCYSFLLEAE
jgi:hypothetical protein